MIPAGKAGSSGGGGSSGGTWLSSPLKLVVLVRGVVVLPRGVVTGEQFKLSNSYNKQNSQ